MISPKRANFSYEKNPRDLGLPFNFLNRSVYRRFSR